jgi:hypothetical protein
MSDGITGGVPITADGRLHGEYANAPRTLDNGDTIGGSGSIAAHFNRGRTLLTGVWHAHVTFIAKTGTRDECDSGSVTFRALQ